MSGVFISYRRDDSAGFAGRLFDKLHSTFPSSKIFIDVDGIDAGLDFIEVLNRRLADCDAFLAIIGQKWLDAKADGSRRIDDPGDYVRIEVEAALKRDIRVIPLLFDGASMPSPKDLPESLAALTRRNCLDISHARFSSDVQRLIDVLTPILPKELPPRTRRTARLMPWVIGASLLIVGATVTALFLPRPTAPVRNPEVVDASPPPVKPGRAAEKEPAPVPHEVVAPPAPPPPAPQAPAPQAPAPQAPTPPAPAPQAPTPPAPADRSQQPALDVVATADLDTPKANARIRLGRDKVVTRKGWCERLTVYTEFGNYSMVHRQIETRPAGEICVLRTEWKDHRTEQILQDDTSAKPRLLNQTLETLCPETYADIAKGCAVH